MAISPVPGGRSSSSTSRSPQNTSARNCCSARCSIGPRQTTGVLPLVNMPMEMTFTSCADGGMIMFSTGVPAGDAQHPRHRVPVDVGVHHAHLLADAASAAARFTVTDDLPTPPLPLATAYTRVSEDGWANGICGSGRPPRSCVCRARRCSSLITSSSTRTEQTPGSLPTAAVTSRVILSRSGQPATVSHTSTSTAPSAATSMFLTMPSSVIGRWISGSCTPSSACLTCSALGGLVRMEVMASWYVAALAASQTRPPSSRLSRAPWPRAAPRACRRALWRRPAQTRSNRYARRIGEQIAG